MLYNTTCSYAGVMELADVSDSKSDGSDTVSVRPRPPVPKRAVIKPPFSLFLIQFCELVILINSKLFKRFFLALCDFAVKIVKIIVALTVNIHNKRP